MNKQDLMRSQTCVLKVNIHCEGCKQKVKKKLHKIDGVQKTSIDAEQGKVIVTGNVDPATLIKKLVKSGKHAELWGAAQRASSYQLHNNHFKNMQVESVKRGKDNKSQNGSQQQVHLQVQGTKGSKYLKVPSKNQKSVKFDWPDDDGSVDFGSDDDDFDEYNYDDEYDDFGSDGQHHLTKKMVPGLGGPPGKNNSKGIKNGNVKGDGNDKKSGGFGISFPLKGITGKKDGKNGNGVKNRKGGNQKSGGDKNHGGMDFKGAQNNNNVGAGGKKNDNFIKKGGGKKEVFHEIDVAINRGSGRKNMEQMGGYQMDQMRYIPTTMASGGGYYYQGMGQGSNPYSLQPMAAQMMMVNQHRMNGSGLFHPMMHSSSHPAMAYGQPTASPVVTENLTHFFSDENTSSCSIM